MKRKSIILLSSILAGSLLVGGAFAAYAVTDNADPFGINVTPGNVDDDSTLDYVTLEWGQSTNLGGVGLLKLGENRKVGVVSLVASTEYTGQFTLNIRDDTADKGEGGKYLFDYLTIRVYAGDVPLGEAGALPSGDPVTGGTITPSTLPTTDTVSGKRVKDLKFMAQGIPAGTKYSIFVSLDGSISPTVFDTMSSDTVRLTVDWNKDPSHTTAESKMVYYDNTSTNWSKVFAFAWKGGVVNAEYPGIEMTKTYGKYYQAFIPIGMENVIFSNGGQGEGNQTADIKLTTTSEYGEDSDYNINTRTLWNGSKWIAYVEGQDTVSVTATRTRNAETTAITLVPAGDPGDNQAVYSVECAEGDVIKFNLGLESIHFYHYDSTQGKVIDDGASYTCATEGTYTFYYNQAGEMFVGTPTIGATYFLVGTHNGWTMDNSSKMTKQSDIHYQFADVEFAAGAAIKVSDGTNWFTNSSTWDGCGFTISNDEDKNVVVTVAGHYNVNLFLNTTNGNYITLDKLPTA